MLHSNESPAPAQNEHLIQTIHMNGNQFCVEERNGNIQFNLTQMGKPFGKKKRPGEWLKTDFAKEYLAELSDAIKIASADLVEVRKGGVPGNQGTWANNYRIAVRYAQFLDVKLAIAVDDLIYKFLTKQAVVAESYKDIWPVVINGVPMYYYMDVLRANNMSTKSGYVYKRPKQLPHHFSKQFGRQFCTLEMCHHLELVAKQQESVRLLQSNQLNLGI